MTTLTATETFLRGVDARPDRVPLILDERVSHGTSTLKLRVGGKAPQRIAVSQHSFGDVRVDHDDRGAPVVAWDDITQARGPRQLFVWSAARGTQQLTTGTLSTSVQSLDVAGDTRRQAAAWRRVSPCSRQSSTSSTRCQPRSHLRLSCIRADDLREP